MERHFSVGVSTIVALMAAHRAASGRDEPPITFSQAAVSRIAAGLVTPVYLAGYDGLQDHTAIDSHLQPARQAV